MRVKCVDATPRPRWGAENELKADKELAAVVDQIAGQLQVGGKEGQ